MSKIYFISDTHYGHNGISDKFRTHFNSDEEHNETIHENILSVSGKRNDLWLLGDIAFKPEHFRKLREYALSFRNVNVVLGNHDHPDLVPFCSDNGIKVYGLEKRWGVWLSHCPIHPDEMYRCTLNIHGHLHGKVIPDDRYFNVSCERVEYKPITLQEIRDRVNG